MLDDTSRCYEDVHENVDVDWQGDDLEDTEGDQLMPSMVDVSRTLGGLGTR